MGGKADTRKSVLGPLWQSLVAVTAVDDLVRYSSLQYTVEASLVMAVSSWL